MRLYPTKTFFWSYRSQGLCGCLWPMLPPKAMVWPRTTCGHVGVWGLCHCHYVDLSGLHCHSGLRWCSGPGCCQEPCLGLWPYNSQGLCWCPWLLLSLTECCVDAQGLDYHLRLCWCLRTMLLLGLYWSGWPALRAMVTSWPKLLPRTMSVSVVLLQLGSEWMSLVRVTTRGHWNHSCWNLRAVLI